MKKAKKLEKRIRVMEEKIDGLDAMLEKMFLCAATLQVEMNFQLKLREEDAAKG